MKFLVEYTFIVLLSEGRQHRRVRHEFFEDKGTAVEFCETVNGNLYTLTKEEVTNG